jgi:hypothetical protein
MQYPERTRPTRSSSPTDSDLTSVSNQLASDFDDRNGTLTCLPAQWLTLVALCELAAAQEMHDRCWQLAFALRGFFFREKLSTPWIRTHRLAVVSAQVVGDCDAMAITLNNLGMAYLDQGDLDEAAECHRQALVSFTELGNEYGCADDARSRHTSLASRRVGGAHFCAPPPSEPCERFVTAHGSSRPRGAVGVAVLGCCVGGRDDRVGSRRAQGGSGPCPVGRVARDAPGSRWRSRVG